MNKISRLVVRAYRAAGGLFIVIGFAQFVISSILFLGGVEVGNILGNGSFLGTAMFLWAAMYIGLLLLLLGWLLEALLGKDTEARLHVAGGPFNGERPSRNAFRRIKIGLRMIALVIGGVTLLGILWISALLVTYPLS